MYQQINTLLNSLATLDGQVQWDSSFESITFLVPSGLSGSTIMPVVIRLLGIGIIPSEGYTVEWIKERLTLDSQTNKASLFFVPLDYLPPLEVHSILPDWLQYLQTLGIGSIYVYDPADKIMPFALNFAYEYQGGEGWINKTFTIDGLSQVMWTWADETWRYSKFAKAGEGFAVGGFNTGIYWKGDGGKRKWQHASWTQGQARHPHNVKEREEAAKSARERTQSQRKSSGYRPGFDWDEPYEEHEGWNQAWEDFMRGNWRRAHEQEEPRPRRRRISYTAQEACSVLGIQWSGSSPLDKRTVQSAYRQLAKQYHPDMLMSHPEAERLAGEERFKEISNAYQVLCQEWSL